MYAYLLQLIIDMEHVWYDLQVQRIFQNQSMLMDGHVAGTSTLCILYQGKPITCLHMQACRHITSSVIHVMHFCSACNALLQCTML